MQIVVRNNAIVATHRDTQDIEGTYRDADVYRAPDTLAVGPDSVLDELGSDDDRITWLAAGVRLRRDRLLAASDPVVLPDYPHPDEETRQAWLKYRRCLRTLPDDAEWPYLSLPEPPA